MCVQFWYLTCKIFMDSTCVSVGVMLTMLVMRQCSTGDACVNSRHCLNSLLFLLVCFKGKKKKCFYALVNKLLNTPCVSVNY